jgi:hypothetical protein
MLIHVIKIIFTIGSTIYGYDLKVYSLRPILLFANTNISIYILMVDISHISEEYYRSEE